MKPLLCVPVLLRVKTNAENIQVMLLALRKTYLFEKMKQLRGVRDPVYEWTITRPYRKTEI